MGNIARFIEDKVLPMKLFKKSDGIKKKYYHITIINTVSYMVSACISQTLHHYLDKVHVAPEDQKYIKMKNEFHYSRLIITFAKKSYVGLLIRQESHIFEKPKIDVKGVNFFKSTASEKTSKFIYDDVLMKRLLNPENGKISLRDVYHDIMSFKKQIAKDIASGDMGFLKRSIKVKSPDAYSNPMGVGAYKSVFLWNYLADDSQQITFPAVTTQVKIILRDKKDAAKLEPWPDIYWKVIKLFDTNPEFGDHIETKADGTQKLVKGKGANSIALPNDMDEVPDWVLAIIDVNTLVNNNMQLFTQLMLPLGLTSKTTTHNKSTMKYYTNIVRL